MRDDWRKVSKAAPCAICGKPDWCKVSADGAVVLCGRIEAGSFEPVKNGQGWLHRLKESTTMPNYIGEAHRHNGNGQQKPKRTYATQGEAFEAAGHGIDGSEAGTWTYEDVDGEPALCVRRWDTADGGKTVRPIHRTTAGWAVGDPPGLLPIYNLPAVKAAQSGQRIFIVEGEKCCAAAESIGLTATTSAHGAKSAIKSDWTPLAGRNVVILPDNDAPGECYAADVQSILAKLNPPAKCRVVKLPDLPEHGDIADFIDARDSLDSEAIRQQIEELADAAAGPRPKTLRELMRQYPALREPMIEKLLRVGETMNIIAPPKTGKSWAVIDLAISAVSGRMWLGMFPTVKTRVLIIDNELHGETSASRVPKVAKARGILTDEYADDLEIVNLRGRLTDIFGMARYFEGIEPGRYGLIILDAFYRFLPRDADENDNATMANIYNALDQYADRLKCCFILIHHSTKGSQAGKAVTDVGAGAGAQSRATDTHLILRQHEEDGCVVLDGVARSWPPIDPVPLRWDFPVWQLAPDLDPTQLREGGRRKRRDDGNGEAKREEWTPESFAFAFIDAKPKSKARLYGDAEVAKLANRKVDRLLALAIEKGVVHRWKAGRDTLFAAIPQPTQEVSQ